MTPDQNRQAEFGLIQRLSVLKTGVERRKAEATGGVWGRILPVGRNMG